MRRRMRSCLPVRSGTASLAPPLGHLADGCDDVGVSGAPADIAAHPLGDLGIGQDGRSRNIRRRIAGPTLSVFGDERDGGAELAGRTVPALESVMAHERGLHRMQNALVGQSLDGGDLGTVMHYRERQAAVDALAVDDDRAGAALSLIAALLRASQSEMLAQCIEQGGAGLQM